MPSRVIITVVDAINETTMPFNEFALYRANMFAEEKHIVLVTRGKSIQSNAIVPENITIIFTGLNIIKIRKLIHGILSECKINRLDTIIHLHSLLGSFILLMSGIGIIDRSLTVFTIHSTYTGYKIHNKILSIANVLLSNYVTFVSNTAMINFPYIVRLIKGNHIKVIHNGANIQRIDRSIRNERCKNEGCDKEFIRFIYVARIIPIKNHIFLLKVLKKVSDNVKFVFVGLNDGSTDILNYVKKEGLENKVEFTGLIPREEVFKELNKSDYYISSSTLEGLPVSVLEAMYVGLPVILSNIPQHEEIASNNPFAVTLPMDVNIWVDTINEFINRNKSEKDILKQQVREYARKNYSVSTMHDKYSDIYLNISNSRSV